MNKIYAIVMWALAVAALITAFIFHNHPKLFLVGTVELALIAIVLNVFVITYAGRNWRANPYGRAMMYSTASLTALTDLSLMTAFLGSDWEFRAFTRALLFCGILLAQTRLLYLLYRTKPFDEQPPDKESEV